MEKLKRLSELHTDAQVEGERFKEGNKTAGKRLRKALLDIKNICHDIRKDVSEIKNK